MTIYCGNCNIIIEESTDKGEDNKKLPCPNWGSLKRYYDITAGDSSVSLTTFKIICLYNISKRNKNNSN